MAATIKTVISIQKTLFDQVETLAQQLNTSRNHLIGIAIENLIKNCQGQMLLDEFNKAGEGRYNLNQQTGASDQNAETERQTDGERRAIHQGDIYWVPLEEPGGLEPGYSHPYVVIQDDVLTRSRINTVVICALTSNIKRANVPGNVYLEAGEANLPRQSVVEVSKVSTVDKTQLGEYIGSLSGQRINQILAGMRFLQLITEHHESDEDK